MPSAAIAAMNRDALYYPYIEIENLNWLKATLLCFPQVRRIVPGGRSPRDSLEIKECLETNGARGTLLFDESPDGDRADQEQRRLARRIEDEVDLFKRRFSKQAAQRRYPKTWNDYQIYYLKIHHELRDVLKSRKLAWSASRGSEQYSLHPKLGRAIMATIAIAIANDKGLDIVTDDLNVHRSVCTQEPEDVLDELLGTGRSSAPKPSSELVDELAGVFMTTYFDVSRLTIGQIAELQRSGNDLRRFRQAILPIAQEIPDVPNMRERKKRLKEGAAAINKEWEKYKKSLPAYAVDAIFEATETQLPAGASAVLGAATYLPFGLVAGAAVGLTAYAGFKVWKKFRKVSSSPFQYLNRIHRAGATLVVPTAVKMDRKRH